MFREWSLANNKKNKTRLGLSPAASRHISKSSNTVAKKNPAARYLNSQLPRIIKHSPKSIAAIGQNEIPLPLIVKY